MRAIDADALLKKEIQERRFVFAYKDFLNDELVVRTVYKDLSEFISDAPTLTLDDLRPKGRWIGTGYDGYADGCPVYDLWECSECRAEFGCVEDPPPYEFCPSCGADMRGGEG